MEITRKDILKAYATFFNVVVFALVVEVLAFVVLVLLFPHHHHPRPPRSRPRPRLLRRPPSRQSPHVPCHRFHRQYRHSVAVSALFSRFFGSKGFEKARQPFFLTRFLEEKASNKCVNVFVDALFGSKGPETAHQCFR